MAAFLGGIGLAFGKAVLVLHVLLAGRLSVALVAGHDAPPAWRRSLSRLALCLGGFVISLIPGISAWPEALSGVLYENAAILKRIAGAVLVVAGIEALLAKIGALRAAGKPGPAASTWWRLPLDAGAGMALGLATSHDIDPSFDSVFFATGTAVAFSHAPLSVAVFFAAMAASLWAAARGLPGLARVKVARGVLFGVSSLGSLGTLAVGILLASGRYEAFTRILGLHF